MRLKIVRFFLFCLMAALLLAGCAGGALGGNGVPAGDGDADTSDVSQDGLHGDAAGDPSHDQSTDPSGDPAQVPEGSTSQDPNGTADNDPSNGESQDPSTGTQDPSTGTQDPSTGSQGPSGGKNDDQGGYPPPVEPDQGGTAPAGPPPEDESPAGPTVPAGPVYDPIQGASSEEYVFGCYLEETTPVADDSYFDDAAFLGDSRTEGFQLWGGIHTGDYFWKRGISVFTVDSQKFTFDVDGESVTMLGAMGKKQYGKIYIMLGINELGYAASSYEKGLSAFLDSLLALQPQAVIYLQTLPPVNDQLAQKYLEAHDRNKNVDAFNQVIVRVAADKRVVLLDTAAPYRGEDGQLPADMSSDGEHFNSKGYPIWADYLRCHTMDPDRYFYWRDQASAGEEAGA